MKFSLISEIVKRSAVAIITCRGKILLGMSTASDDRKGLWCFPGGGVKNLESPDRAVTREAKEEMGITCRVVAGPIMLANKPNVSFYHCKASTFDGLKHNKEFTAAGWFTVRELRGLKLHNNVRQLLAKFDIS